MEVEEGGVKGREVEGGGKGEEVRGEEVRGEEVREEEVEGGGDGPTTTSTKKVSHLAHDRSSRSWCAGCQWWPRRHG